MVHICLVTTLNTIGIRSSALDKQINYYDIKETVRIQFELSLFLKRYYRSQRASASVTVSV